MKLRKIIALQLAMMSIVGITACGTVDRKSSDAQDDIQYETIINKLFIKKCQFKRRKNLFIKLLLRTI